MPFNPSEEAGFAIQPKLDCPHINDQKIKDLAQFLLNKNSHHFSEFQCHECKDQTQNWICLECQTLGCSRYVKGHMAEHNSVTKHQIALSFSDGSFWCYDCESYIDALSLRQVRIRLSNSKFASDPAKVAQEEEEEKEKQILRQLESLAINAEKQGKSFKYEELIDSLKNNKYERVVVLTGAGLSVASGIPDFRSPGTGLYSQLAKYNLPYPEAVFQLGFFIKNPEPFMRVAKELLSGQHQPTLGHKFIKKLQEKGILSKNLTQNIDDLETKAGISPQKLIQAHGHSRSAHCIKHLCQKEASIEKWKEQLEKLEPMKCESCQGLVKPDIVFFGEQLPKDFFEGPEIVKEADLVLIIGTSMAVAPFSFLGTMVKETCPLVLINNQDSVPYRKDKLWLKGDIQDDIQKIMKDLDWL